MPYTVNQTKDVASAWVVGVVTLLCLLLVSALQDAPYNVAAPGLASGAPAEWSIGTIVPNPVAEHSR